MPNKKDKGMNIMERDHMLRKDIRSELKLQIDSFKSDIENRYKLDKQSLSDKNKRYYKIALFILGILGVTSVGGLYFVLDLASRKANQALNQKVEVIQESINKRLDEEFKTKRISSLIEQTAKKYTEGEVQRYISERVDTAITPVQKVLNGRLVEYDKQLTYINKLVEIYELESLARNGSRSGFEKLRSYSARGDRLGISASSRISTIKKIYEVLRNPQFVMIGNVNALKNGKPIPFEELKTIDMILLLNDKNASLDQVHKMITFIWNKPKNEIKPYLLRLLEESDNLAASVAACAILSHAFGQKADIFEFEKWIKYLKQ